MTQPARRYEALDALRGVAALAVVVFHLRAVNLAPDLAPHAHLAVDFFFVLSGFVVAHAYGERLAGRMTWRLFAARRLIRLVPLAFIGALIGLVGVIVRWRLAPGHADPLDRILISGVLNLALLPTVFSGARYGYAAFPGDGPLWSLFFELAVNLVWGWCGVRLTIRQLAGVVALAAICLITLSVLHGSTRMGVAWTTFWGGAARATFGFSLGVLIYRIRDRLPGAAWSGAAPTACVALIVAFVAPAWLTMGQGATLAWDLTWILVLLPTTVVLAAGQERMGRFSRGLGALSYPLYVLHYPCLAALSGFREKYLPWIEAFPFGLMSTILVVALSWAALKLYDEPVRRWLSQRLTTPS